MTFTHRLGTTLSLVVTYLVATPSARADNCSSLSDCAAGAPIALGVLAIAVVVGVALAVTVTGAEDAHDAGMVDAGVTSSAAGASDEKLRLMRNVGTASLSTPEPTPGVEATEPVGDPKQEEVTEGSTEPGAFGEEDTKAVERVTIEPKVETSEEERRAVYRAARQDRALRRGQDASSTVRPSPPPGYGGPTYQFGKEVGWPHEVDGILTELLPERVDLERITRFGGGEAWARSQAHIYRGIAHASRNDPVALRRAEWLDAIADRLAHEASKGRRGR